MSVYFNKNLNNLQPYTPGEQPQGGVSYIKLNTNESPYPPSGKIGYSTEHKKLRLYPDPECTDLCAEIARVDGVTPDNVLPVNGSDEALAFAFAAFGEKGAIFPDVTYGFYKVFAELFGVKYKQIPLNGDFTVNPADYIGKGKTVILANPNAQTGIYLPLTEIEKIVAGNPKNVVVIDEAYIDFGGESAVKLINKYKNLLVVRTFSKSRNLAGARVGYAMADIGLIADLKRIKYSFNPYNVNRLSAKIATAALKDGAYFDKCRRKIIATRAKLVDGLKSLRFSVLPSLANFVMAQSTAISGQQLYLKLKDEGFLVRHFDDERIRNFVRITVGTDAQIKALLKAIEKILENGNEKG